MTSVPLFLLVHVDLSAVSPATSDMWLNVRFILLEIPLSQLKILCCCSKELKKQVGLERGNRSGIQRSEGGLIKKTDMGFGFVAIADIVRQRCTRFRPGNQFTVNKQIVYPWSDIFPRILPTRSFCFDVVYWHDFHRGRVARKVEISSPNQQNNNSCRQLNFLDTFLFGSRLMGALTAFLWRLHKN